MPWRKYLSAPYLKWPFWFLITIMWVNIFLVSNENGFMNWSFLVKETGELAWKLLAFTIFLSLIRKLFPKCATLVRILPLRKHSGILAFLIASSHAIAQLVRLGIHKNWEAIFAYSFSFNSPVTLGAISFVLMLPLFFTSTEWAVKKMGAKGWFWLHKLAHPSFILASLHFAWATGKILYTPFVWLGIYVLSYSFLGVKRVLAKRKYHEFNHDEGKAF